MDEIYFDTAATTPLLQEVKDAVIQSFDVFGNPSSLHRRGVEAEDVIEGARKKVLKALGVQQGRIVFTGGGSEADNLAIFGTARKYQNRGRHIVTTQIEHPAVLEPVRALEQEGWRATYVAPDPDGFVPAERILGAVTDDTVLVSMMHVNNETGALLPIGEVGEALKKYPKVLFHVDGIQGFGKIPGGIRNAAIDLYSMSGHKIGALKGTGALYLRHGVTIHPLVYGGGQEQGLRSGTENVSGIAAFGAAAEWASKQVDAHFQHVSKLAEQLCEGLNKLPRCTLHLPRSKSPYVVSASFRGLKGEVLVHALESEGLFVSTGSACSTHGGQSKGSHVLQAMNLDGAEITGTLRFSLAPWHSVQDVNRALEIVEAKVQWLVDLER